MAPRGTQESWLRRNAVWLGSIGALAVAALVVATLIGLTAEASSMFAYAEGLALARAEPEVVDALGEPITAKLGFREIVNLQNSDDNSDFSIPIEGPKGQGMLHVVATQEDGVWTLDAVEVTLAADDARRIDLLAGDATRR